MKIIWGESSDSMTMSFPIMKSARLEDGRLMIEGVATSEAVDSDDEVIDYESAKAAFSEWKGNIREQHDPKKAVGKAVEIVADDESKQIIVKAFISKGAQDTQDKIADGTLSCFSIGGRVAKRIKEKATKSDGSTADVTRLFIKRISETSVVDSGANPDSAFAIVKSDGDNLFLVEHGEDHPAIDSLAEMLNKGQITPDRLLELAKAETSPPKTEEPTKDTAQTEEAVKTEPAGEVKKGLYGVSRFADLLGCLHCLATDAAYESQWEGDNSPIPSALREWLVTGAGILQDMAKEELEEMLATLQAIIPSQSAVIVEASDKTAKAGKKFSAATKGALKGAHEAMKTAVGHMEKLGYEDDEEGDGADKSASSDVQKAELAKLSDAHDEIMKAARDAGCEEGGIVAEFITKISTERDTLAKRVKALESLPAPGKALLKAIGKADDVGGAEEKKVDPVKNPDGSENQAASIIKSIHAHGGQVTKI